MAIVANPAGTRAHATADGWPGVVVELLEGGAHAARSEDVSALLLRAAADYVVHGGGWRRGAMPLNPGGEASTLAAIHLAALPFGWPFAEHLARWRAAVLRVHAYLMSDGLYRGPGLDNPVATLTAWDLSPTRCAADVWELLEGAADGRGRCGAQGDDLVLHECYRPGEPDICDSCRHEAAVVEVGERVISGGPVQRAARVTVA